MGRAMDLQKENEREVALRQHLHGKMIRSRQTVAEEDDVPSDQFDPHAAEREDSDDPIQIREGSGSVPFTPDQWPGQDELRGESDKGDNEDGDDLESMTVEELRQEAAEYEIEGRSGMNKKELIAAIRAEEG